MNKYFVFLICSLQLVLVSCIAQVPGCTDPMAINYDPSASVNDGSCLYDPVSVSPISTEELSESLAETSGLIQWDGYVWSHNDNGDTKLYGLDTITALIKQEIELEDVINVEWEEISQDENYIYIGDFGNNYSGNRTDLHILRIEKSSLRDGTPEIDTIWFSYSDQYDLDPADENTTDFDCEAFIVSEDSLYLFTKQWTSAQTSVYSLPKIPGTYSAHINTTFDIQGLVTGATCIESGRLVVLCGYTSLLHPFFWLLYDFNGHDFFSGNKRRVTVSLPFHQLEAITTENGLKYYVSNEAYIIPFIANNPQKLHIFDLSDLLEEYMDGPSSLQPEYGIEEIAEVYPNPALNLITIKSDQNQPLSAYEILDQSGSQVMQGKLASNSTVIDISNLVSGIYLLKVKARGKQTLKIIKL